MKSASSTLLLLAAETFWQAAYAAPAQALATYNSDPADVPTQPVSASGIPGATGSIRGGANLAGYDPSNPINPGPSTVSSFQVAPVQTESADLGLYLDLQNVDNPQPIRGSTDAPTDPGPRNYDYDILNSDVFAPPGTDSGSIPNAKWPFGLSHNRHGTPSSAGWARQENTDDLPDATAMAGVDMRLSPSAYRELHWHQANEWSLILNGSVRVSATNDYGQTFIDDLQAGDVWFFPAGMPHSIQAGTSGTEFLLIFDNGAFNEDSTFLVSELFERNPRSVLAKDLRTDVSSFDNLPDGQLYIFPGTPFPQNISEQNVTGSAGSIPQASTYSYHFSQESAYEVPGGSVKIIDSVNFPIADNFAAALVTVHPGAMREIHWHPTSDEWNYFLAGNARITIFSSPDSSNTFDFTAGDVGYIPATETHYIENTASEDVVFLEVLQAPQFTDISVAQWLGLTPPQVVKDTLKLPDEVVQRLPKEKPYILPGNPDLRTTNFTSEVL